MSLPVRRMIAQNLRIAHRPIYLQGEAERLAVGHSEVTRDKVHRICMTMDINEHMEPDTDTVKAWLWEKGESPTKLPKTTDALKHWLVYEFKYPSW